MDTNSDKTSQSITSPEAEAAHRHLSWTADNDEDHDGYTSDDGIVSLENTYISYTGYPDGSFEVAVTMQRGDTVAVQSERGFGYTPESIRDLKTLALERAARALLILREVE